jgi:peptidyl-prolyl cis-trans isomerase SurA
MDKEVTQKLALEAYNRMKKDVRASHILIAVNEDASEKEVQKAYDKAIMVKAELGKGGPFGKSAVKYTDHKPSRLKGGDLGFMTAILPKGFYGLETYLYEGELEKISDPIRTKLGYHIVKVVERRAARGKMDLAHILIRKKDSHDHGEKAIIDTAYARLLRGMAFVIKEDS